MPPNSQDRLWLSSRNTLLPVFWASASGGSSRCAKRSSSSVLLNLNPNTRHDVCKPEASIVTNREGDSATQSKDAAVASHEAKNTHYS